MKDFLLWTNSTDENLLPDGHPLKNYSSKEYFAYADYMHLPELFDENKEDPLIHVGRSLILMSRIDRKRVL